MKTSHLSRRVDFGAPLKSFLAGLPSQVVSRGLTYAGQGRVAVDYEWDGHFVSATVRGSFDYETFLSLEEGVITSSCSCPQASDCKHSAALAVVASALSPHNASTQEVASTKAQRREASPHYREFEERLQRRLERSERMFIDELVGFVRLEPGSSSIRKNRLRQLLAPRETYFGYTGDDGPVALWVRRPKSLWAVWCHLALAAQDAGIAIPAWLADVTDVEPYRATYTEALSAQMIESWQHVVDASLETTPLTTSSRVDLQLHLTPGELSVFIRHKQSTVYVKALKKDIRTYAVGPQQWNRDLSSRGRTAAAVLWAAAGQRYSGSLDLRYDSTLNEAILVALHEPTAWELFRNARGEPLTLCGEGRFEFRPNPASSRMYDAVFCDRTGAPIEDILVLLGGDPFLVVTARGVFRCPRIPTDHLLPSLGGPAATSDPTTQCFNRWAQVPRAVIEQERGVAFAEAFGVVLPPECRVRIVRETLEPEVVCTLVPRRGNHAAEDLRVSIYGTFERRRRVALLGMDWSPVSESGRRSKESLLSQWKEPKFVASGEPIRRVEYSALMPAIAAIDALSLTWNSVERGWEAPVTKSFPERFLAWYGARPPGLRVQLDDELATLVSGTVTATVAISIDGVANDWFDIHAVLNVDETLLTKEEIELLLAASGQFVRLGAKGWRRLEVVMSEADRQMLAELGIEKLTAGTTTARRHTMQIFDTALELALKDRDKQALRRRAEQIRLDVRPPVPAAMQATLRDYQREGFHFLAYLTENSFGGLLADDMGLGKTVQTLTWLLWLKDRLGKRRWQRALVVCPKSVVDTWLPEIARFAPTLKVVVLNGTNVRDPGMVDVAVVNYAMFREYEHEIAAHTWSAVVLDEAQYIKNPSSQTARAACRLATVPHRLALTGTPIENRLLDLWSIMRFAMPGILGPERDFKKISNNSAESAKFVAKLARPFMLRRTKEVVAHDLPERVEEEILCTMEGPQSKTYTAELKRARQMLLAVKTQADLGKLRFSILSSLLRLRQICCDPELLSKAAVSSTDSAKRGALLDLVQPLVERGEKVLLFSQFTTMLDILERDFKEAKIPFHRLDGTTIDRRGVVEAFRTSDDGSVFLISLKAGGAGLNLIEASYVVLYDPWWNPAVERQAIDRTHRIGQSRTVFAYRLIAKNTIEEKIRVLQRKKAALAASVLSEEATLESLTLDDFRYLLAAGRADSAPPEALPIVERPLVIPQSVESTRD